MQYGICCVPVSSMRKEPSHRSEIVSQCLFGEFISIQKEKDDQWVKIKSLYDGYDGWMPESHAELMVEDATTFQQNILTGNELTPASYDNQTMYLPMGCNIELPASFARKHKFSIEGMEWDKTNALISEENIKLISGKYLNTTYLWGGKSIFGIDCSGFAQTVYKFFNITILRDAYLQATQGEHIGFLQEMQCGDLAFFDNAEGRITHVGILLNDHEIIHASGKVRIDNIDTKGIVNTDTGLRTHNLRLIKRYFNL